MCAGKSDHTIRVFDDVSAVNQEIKPFPEGVCLFGGRPFRRECREHIGACGAGMRGNVVDDVLDFGNGGSGIECLGFPWGDKFLAAGIGRTEEMHLAGTQTSADGEKQRTDVGSLFVIPDAPDFIKDILLLDGVGDGVRQGYLRSRARDAVGNLFAEDFFGFIARQPLFFDGRRSGLCGSNIGGRFGRSLSGCGLSGSLIRRSGRFGRGFDRSVFRGSGLCRLFLSGRSLGGRGFRRRDGTFLPAGAFGSGLRIGLCAHDGVGRRQFRLADPQRHMRGLLAPLLNHFGIGYQFDAGAVFRLVHAGTRSVEHLKDAFCIRVVIRRCQQLPGDAAPGNGRKFAVRRVDVHGDGREILLEMLFEKVSPERSRIERNPAAETALVEALFAMPLLVGEAYQRGVRFFEEQSDDFPQRHGAACRCDFAGDHRERILIRQE